MNAKNKLQELCQRNGLEVPKYETTLSSLSSQNVMYWVTCVTIPHLYSYTHTPVGGKKVDSEMETAQAALQDITDSPELCRRIVMYNVK